MAAEGGGGTGRGAPLAAVFVSPFQDRQVPCPCGGGADAYAPAAVGLWGVFVGRAGTQQHGRLCGFERYRVLGSQASSATTVNLGGVDCRDLRCRTETGEGMKCHDHPEVAVASRREHWVRKKTATFCFVWLSVRNLVTQASGN